MKSMNLRLREAYDRLTKLLEGFPRERRLVGGPLDGKKIYCTSDQMMIPRLDERGWFSEVYKKVEPVRDMMFYAGNSR